MIKHSQKIVLVSFDADLNKALLDQFELMRSLKIKVCNDLNDLNKIENVDLIIFNDASHSQELSETLLKIRTNNKPCPTIVLTEYFDSSIMSNYKKIDKFVIIEKPFEYEFLEKTILAQLKKNAPQVIYFNKIKFYPSTKLLVNDLNTEVRLTEKESDILMFLYRYANQVISKKILLNEVWGYKDGVTTHTLETHLYYLRKKLDNENIISTEKGGYLLSL